MIFRFLDQQLYKQYLEKREKVVYVGHKHIVLLIKPLFVLAAFGVALPWFLYMSNPELLMAAVSIAVLSWFRFLYRFLLWFFDCWVITNKGVIDIAWESFFNRKNIRFAFDNFEGITTEINGFWRTILRMGDVMLIRIVDTNQIRLTDAGNPNKIESKVLKAKTDYHHHINEDKMKKEEFITGVIADMVADYAERNNIDLR